MAISDDRQRVMPMPLDRITGQPLAYPEAVLLTNPINPKLRGEVINSKTFILISHFVINKLMTKAFVVCKTR